MALEDLGEHVGIARLRFGEPLEDLFLRERFPSPARLPDLFLQPVDRRAVLVVERDQTGRELTIAPGRRPPYPFDVTREHAPAPEPVATGDDALRIQDRERAIDDRVVGRPIERENRAVDRTERRATGAGRVALNDSCAWRDRRGTA